MKNSLFILVASGLLVFESVFAADSPTTTDAEKNITAVKAELKDQYWLAIKQSDDVEATKMFRKLAQNGLPDAQYTLGLRAFKGKGMPADTVEAARWLKLAAMVGVPDAAEHLGVVIRTMNADQKRRLAFKNLCICRPRQKTIRQ